MRTIRTIVCGAAVATAMNGTLTSCDGSWEDLKAWGAGSYNAGSVTVVVAAAGDFTPGQRQDIASVVDEWSRHTGCTMIYIGEAPWRAGPEQPANHVIFEKGNTWAGSMWVPGYGWPGNDGQGNARAGLVRIGRMYDNLPAPTAPSYTSGPTFRGVALHEAGHALGTLGDRYDNDYGHPELIMGTGFRHFNTLAVGDVNGARALGCRRP